MFSGLTLVHRPSSVLPLELGEGWTVWKTCLRQIALTLHAGQPQGRQELLQLLPGDQLYRGHEAYQFLLEVICGLHSRVLGENEIVGQFKAHFLERGARALDGFAKVTQWLLADMKLVRSRHSMNAGSHSYGSYCRKMSEDSAEVSVFGTGELSLAILPWLEKKARITVFYRSESGRDSLIERLMPTHPDLLKRIQFCSYDELSSQNSLLGGTLVIAAPLSARKIEEVLLGSEVLPKRIIDLRGECEQDPIVETRSSVLDLQDFFSEAAAVTEASGDRRSKALQEISHLTLARQDAASILIRPMGWEDLCG